jgi:hypothetical protein
LRVSAVKLMKCPAWLPGLAASRPHAGRTSVMGPYTKVTSPGCVKICCIWYTHVRMAGFDEPFDAGTRPAENACILDGLDLLDDVITTIIDIISQIEPPRVGFWRALGNGVLAPHRALQFLAGRHT